MDIKKIVADTEDTTEGAWVDYTEEEGVRFKLAYIGSDKYQDFVNEKMTRARRGRRDIPQDKSRAIIVEALARFVLKGWEGIEEGGEPLPINTENAKRLLTSFKVREFVANEANDIDNFGSNGTRPVEDDTPVGDMKSGAPVAPPVGT